MRDIIFFSCICKVDAGRNLELHTHEHMDEIIYYVKGTGTTTIGGRKYKYKPNFVVYIPKGVSHDEVRQTDTKSMSFTFDMNSVPEALKTGKECAVYADSPNILFLLQFAVNELAEQKYHYEELVLITLQQILIILSRSNETGGIQSKSMEYVIKYIEEYYSSDIKADTLAKMCNYSYDHFRHMFKEKTGTSPQQFILNKRLENAIYLLTNSDNSITKVAMNSGFSSASSFSNIFKRLYGISPKEYRKGFNTGKRGM